MLSAQLAISRFLGMLLAIGMLVAIGMLFAKRDQAAALEIVFLTGNKRPDAAA
jgi:hypothetical protein